MITVYWHSTGAVCTRFRSARYYLRWRNTSGTDGVTRRMGRHPSIDLRDVDIVISEPHQTEIECLLEANYWGGEPI